MRKVHNSASSDYRIAILDDEAGIIDSISIVLKRIGYDFTGFLNQHEAIEKIRSGHYDLLILDYLMDSMHGDEVVKRIREFDKDLYILLLTGHKDIAPPLETLKSLDIQGYCEKSDKFDQLILLIESAIKSINQMHTIRKFRDGLSQILKTVPEIYQLQPVGNILERILVGIMPFVESANAFVLVDDANGVSSAKNKSIFKGIGKYEVSIEDFISMLSPGLMEFIGYSRTNGQIMKYQSGIILPLINENKKTIGVMFVETATSEDGIRLLEIYSHQAASSITNAFLHSLVNMKNEELNMVYEELKKRYIDTIEVLRLSVDAKDVYTRGHSDRVAYYAVKIGQACGLPDGDLETLRLGGFFHDIGKIATADDILYKTESLDNKEYDEIKKHTLKGAHILSAVSMFKSIVPLIKYHHERMDGKGYPEGLKGNQIPLLARILSVADAFDAMTSDRLYRSKLDVKEAVDQLVKASGTQFDKDIVDRLIGLLDDFDAIAAELTDTFGEKE